jgi:hypothetical protein
MLENYDLMKLFLDHVETSVELSSHVQLKLIENQDVYPKQGILLNINKIKFYFKTIIEFLHNI